ncbi:MAG: KH domain-containing protein [Acidimicrobiia bacterium]|nr:KH domain-containing protein [bacterium]MXX65366.1 KH domain-containing protein [Acidimicrobiia bacterium]MCY3580847.1 KH domain-containing protein [bacterium]MCY3653055.1 KH domain-containing protein [bacterium]MDE0644430.1 KH domain-containing protein [bacterium]
MKDSIVERVIRYVVTSIVDNAEAVDISLVDQGEDHVLAEVKTAPGEMGRVIGRGGRVARAIRAIAQAAGDEEGLQVAVEFVD